MRTVPNLLYSEKVQSPGALINMLTRIPSWIALQWRISAVVACGVGLAATCKWCFESEQTRAQRVERKLDKELRALAHKISAYGHSIHRNYPTGDVIVNTRDLAEQLHKRPEVIATALDNLLAEGKVQRSSFQGYWKLNV